MRVLNNHIGLLTHLNISKSLNYIIIDAGIKRLLIKKSAMVDQEKLSCLCLLAIEMIASGPSNYHSFKALASFSGCSVEVSQISLILATLVF